MNYRKWFSKERIKNNNVQLQGLIILGWNLPPDTQEINFVASKLSVAISYVPSILSQRNFSV